MIMSKICDVDESGDVLCTYVDGGKDGIKAERTRVPIPKAVLYAFLPAGFPHTVTEDYLAYQTFDSLQAFSSSITNLLASRAILEGLGVGKAGQTPTAALFLQITQDTFSRLATILFAHRMGQAIEPECKYYRFIADIFNDCSQFLDLLLPVLPLFPKVSVMVTASILRALCGVAAGASKATLSAHFAKTGNLAELNAKEASQETVVSLMGMLAGTLLVKVVHDKTAVWMWMILLVGVHLTTNYYGVKSVRMTTLNRQRATIVFREWLNNGTVLDPAEVARRESILFNSRGNLSSRSGNFTGTCDFGGYGDIVKFRPWGYHQYMFDMDNYYMGIWHWGPRFFIKIAVKEGKHSVNDPLMAWFDAVTHAYFFDTALKDGLRSSFENELPSGYVSHEKKEELMAALKVKGWSIETYALEIKNPVRVRVGEGKKAAPAVSEKQHLLFGSLHAQPAQDVKYD